MKRLIIAASVALGVACASSASAARLETYAINLHFGYGLIAFVGNSPAEYARAKQAADNWEGRRHLGLGPLTVAAVAIDNSAGLTREVRVIGPDKAVAVVKLR